MITLRKSSLTGAQALLALLSLNAQAQTPTPKVFAACYGPLTGVVYRIKETGISSQCLHPTHVEFSWTRGADAGPITGVEGRVTAAEGRITTAEGRITTAEGQISGLANSSGAVNDAANPVSWTQLKDIPTDVTSGGVTIRFHQVRKTSNSAAPGALAVAYAQCEIAEQVTGGGFIFDVGIHNLIVTRSRPLLTSSQGWDVVAYNPPDASTNASIEAYAICMSR